MGIRCILFTEPSDAESRLLRLAAMLSEEGGHWGHIAREIAAGVGMGLSADDAHTIGTARELNVFDCVSPYGWAISTGNLYTVGDRSTSWSYPDDPDASRAP